MLTDSSVPEKKNLSSFLLDILSGFSGLIVSAIAFVIILLILHFYGIINLATIFTPLNSLPRLAQVTKQPSPTSEPLVFDKTRGTIADGFEEKCPVDQSKNPLVNQIDQTNDGSVGTIHGHIQNFMYDPTKKEAQITIISVKGDQQHTFTVKDTDGIVQDGNTYAQEQLSNIHEGESVSMSFMCSTSNNSIFTISDLLVTDN